MMRVPEPYVHLTAPYPRWQWRVDVNVRFQRRVRRLARHLSSGWKQQLERQHPFLLLYK